MKSLKNDPALAALPAPITLAPAQLAEVAAGTSAALPYAVNLHIYGGIMLPPMALAISAPPAAA